MSEDHEVLDRIASEARTPARHVRHLDACLPGFGVRQGDVYLFMLRREPEHGEELGTRQLVAGNSIGSRHAVEGDATLYKAVSYDRLAGPIVHARSRVTIVHPEHAHISLPPAWYEVRYQPDFENIDHKTDTERPASPTHPAPLTQSPVRD